MERPELLDSGLSRRTFIQATSAVAAASLLPAWLAEKAYAATPIGPNDGVIVLLTMGGGNDGLNTFIPITSGPYYDARQGLAFQPNDTLGMRPDRGMNKYLPFLKSQWDRGHLAVVEGVGTHSSHLSHFVSMAQLMAARNDGRIDGTGWLGRYLDGFSADPFRAIAVNSSVPPVVVGRRNRATAIHYRPSSFFDLASDTTNHRHALAAMKAMADGTVERGPYGDRIGDLGKQAIGLANTVGPLVQEQQDEAEVITKMRLAARLINANLGIRVLTVSFGDFDTHSNQQSMHRDRMLELDAALRAFHTTLSATFASRTLVVGTSEFGRRVKFNGSGTDHGTANAMFVSGPGVVGGLHGALPSLTELDRYGNMTPTVDYRHVYANLASFWLRGDASEIIGRNFSDLGFLRRPQGSGSSGSPSIPITPATPSTPNTPSTPAGPEPTPVSYLDTGRAQIARLYLAFFRRLPDDAGHNHWVGVLESGRSLASIADEFASAPEFVKQYGTLSNRQFVNLIYNNVLGRRADDAGLSYWVGLLDKGDRRGSVMIGFSESAEFARATAPKIEGIEAIGPVGRLYWAYFLRKPDSEGLRYWVGAGLSPDAVSDQFSASKEFTNRYGKLSDGQFVNLIYKNVLGRQPDPGGFAYWSKQLASGKSRGSVMLGFSNSPEFVTIVKRRG